MSGFGSVRSADESPRHGVIGTVRHDVLLLRQMQAKLPGKPKDVAALQCLQFQQRQRFLPAFAPVALALWAPFRIGAFVVARNAVIRGIFEADSSEGISAEVFGIDRVISILACEAIGTYAVSLFRNGGQFHARDLKEVIENA
jgi:hypothetical protein